MDPRLLGTSEGGLEALGLEFPRMTRQGPRVNIMTDCAEFRTIGLRKCHVA